MVLNCHLRNIGMVVARYCSHCNEANIILKAFASIVNEQIQTTLSSKAATPQMQKFTIFEVKKLIKGIVSDAKNSTMFKSQQGQE